MVFFKKFIKLLGFIVAYYIVTGVVYYVYANIYYYNHFVKPNIHFFYQWWIWRVSNSPNEGYSWFVFVNWNSIIISTIIMVLIYLFLKRKFIVRAFKKIMNKSANSRIKKLEQELEDLKKSK